MLVTAAGTGFSALGDAALGSWTGDRVADLHGLFIYLRDLENGESWSIGHQPLRRPTEEYLVSWEPGRFTIARSDDGIDSRLEVCVPPDATAELRRLTLRNRSRRSRRIEITSWTDVVLSGAASHASHPVFSRLFLQTEWAASHAALLARRRPRSVGERHPWLVHALFGHAVSEYETDRARFLGRGRTPHTPAALLPGARLSGTAGNVLDPCVALRCTLDLPAGASTECRFLLGAAVDRDAALALAGRFARGEAAAAAFESAVESARGTLDRLGLDSGDAESYESLAGAMLYGNPVIRADPSCLSGLEPPLDDLASLGLGPESAIAVLHAETPAGLALLPEALRMQRYWRTLGLHLELVVVAGTDRPAALDALDPAIRPRLFRAEELSRGALAGLDSVGRLVIRGPLPEPLRLSGSIRFATDAAAPAAGIPIRATPSPARAEPSVLRLFNGTGGFTADGREYVLRLSRPQGGASPLPPQPWVNVIANERFGFLVSETGAGCTWSGNSREHRLTPWSNDPVADPHGEALYVRDAATGEFWSPLPGPRSGDGVYEVRHGIGSSRWRHGAGDIETEAEVFVAAHDPVKCSRLRVRNRGADTRRLSVFSFAHWVLGDRAEESGRFVVTEIQPRTRTVWARNPMAGEYAGALAFAAVVLPPGVRSTHATADREAFLGRHGSMEAPAALCGEEPLDGRSGAGLDACAAHQIEFDLAPGETMEIAFLLGEGEDADEARSLVAKYESTEAVQEAYDEMRAFWEAIVGAIQVETPSPALDLMLNGWLPYQLLSCRIWGRTAFYQSGGAYGFRDQLQDASALVYSNPERFRSQILLHAAHQFAEGDVLHWWHPPLGRGLRTRFADDLLWLPYLAAFYVRTTGDEGILDEQVRYLTARQLRPGEDETYLLPEPSADMGDLYDHCCRALDRSLACGAHGLPLFGTGDWNDGMNRVGREGRGESVWMGFFLCAVLGDFLPHCERRGDSGRVRRYATHREALQRALETSGWDGAWYRRGYYDDGTPLGTSAGDECRIDALVQAWAVISGAAPEARAARALDAVEEHLISEPEGLLRLLWPPFDRTPHDPGYIKGYVPGVRENGGQYTHAALWVVRALAELGRNDRAARLLEMLSPVTRAATPERVATYQVEPYVVAADVYGAPPHVGRGGWTWYTGSAGWMQRVLLESILGLQVEAGRALRIFPCVPDDWPGFRLAYRIPGSATLYEIRATNPHRAGRGAREARVDGKPVRTIGGVARIPIERDGGVHRVELVLGGPPEGSA